MQRRPEIKLVIIDPAEAYIGRSGIDEHKDAELRSLLGPLAELAAERGVTVLLVKHFNKGVTAKAVHRVSGSTGYVNSVRTASVVVPDPDEAGRKLLLPVKTNIGPEYAGLAFRLEAATEDVQLAVLEHAGDLSETDRQALTKQLFVVTWLGPASATTDDAVSATGRQRKRVKADDAAEWLVKFLAEFACPSEDLFKEGAKRGFSRKTLFEAMKKLGHEIQARNMGRFQGVWHWGLGPHEHWRLRSTPPSNTTRVHIAHNQEIEGNNDEFECVNPFTQ